MTHKCVFLYKKTTLNSLIFDFYITKSNNKFHKTKSEN